MAPKKKEKGKQENFFASLGVEVDETYGRKVTGGHVERHKVPERTARDIQNPATQPIVGRITTTNASVWTDT